MATYYIMNHSRGNHTAQQVFNFGKIHMQGTKKECIAAWKEMRKFLREKFKSTNTNAKLSDFIAYEMGDKFFVKKQGDQISWA